MAERTARGRRLQRQLEPPQPHPARAGIEKECLSGTATDSSTKTAPTWRCMPHHRCSGCPHPTDPHVVSAALSSSVPSGQDSYPSGNTVTFNEAVAVNTSSGTPKLPLCIGHNLRAAAYTPIDSTNQSPLTTSRKFPSTHTCPYTISADTGATKCTTASSTSTSTT